VTHFHALITHIIDHAHHTVTPTTPNNNDKQRPSRPRRQLPPPPPQRQRQRQRRRPTTNDQRRPTTGWRGHNANGEGRRRTRTDGEQVDTVTRGTGPIARAGLGRLSSRAPGIVFFSFLFIQLTKLLQVYKITTKHAAADEPPHPSPRHCKAPGNVPRPVRRVGLEETSSPRSPGMFLLFILSFIN
jgi:hypothetical protein